MSNFDHLDSTQQELETQPATYEPLTEPAPAPQLEEETVDQFDSHEEHGGAINTPENTSPSVIQKLMAKPILLLAPALVLLLMIFGSVALAMRYLNPETTAPVAMTTPSPRVLSPSPTPTPEASELPWNPPVADNLANATDGAIFASPKVTPSPTSSSPKPSPSPSTGPLANLYFHKVACVVTNPSQGTSTEDQMHVSGKTYTKDAAPTTIQCNLIFQNSENVETGNITFDVLYDGRTIKRENVGTLKKGNHPVSEFKDYGVTITDPSKDAGEHTVQVRINPDKTFAESNFNDNTYTAKYTITQ